MLFIISSLYAKSYEMPQIEFKKGNVPMISDEQIEFCVKLYNQIKWLSEDLTKQKSSKNQANARIYNINVKKYRNLANLFNNECAGKLAADVKTITENLNEVEKKSSKSN